MTEEDIIFSGGGGSNPLVLMCENWTAGGGDRRVTAFDPGYSVYALAVSPSGNRLAAGTRAGLLRVQALEAYRPRENATPIFEVFHGANLETSVLALAFLTDALLASGGQDGQIKLWDIHRHQQVAQIDAHPGGVVALCPLGSLVLASIGLDGVLRVWDLDTLRADYQSDPFPLPKIKALTGLDFHAPSGQLVHASRSGDLHVYDTRHDFAKRLIRVHDGDFCAVACGTEWIATAGSAEPSLKIWSPTFDRPVCAASLAGPVTGIGWAGEQAVMTVGQDGDGSFWRVDHGLSKVSQAGGQDLRTCVGLPPALIHMSRRRRSREWREQKLTEAGALVAQSEPEARQHLFQILEELHARGFSAEANLLLADAARADNRFLWELETRLALANGLGDDPAAIPAHYTVAQLLEGLNEPELAVVHYEKALQLDGEHRDAKDRIGRLRSHPLMGACPQDSTRADFGKGEAIPQEIEKATVLNRKFCWRCVFDVRRLGTEPGMVGLEELAESMKVQCARTSQKIASVSLLPTALIQDDERRQVQWLHVSNAGAEQGLAFALELDQQDNGTGMTAYGVFDPALLNLPEDVPVRQHNHQVQAAWEHLARASETATWLGRVHGLVDQAIRRATSYRDREW